jgi:hypothetical protein
MQDDLPVVCYLVTLPDDFNTSEIEDNLILVIEALNKTKNLRNKKLKLLLKTRNNKYLGSYEPAYACSTENVMDYFVPNPKFKI